MSRFRNQRNQSIHFLNFFYIVPSLYTYLKFRIFKKLNFPIVNWDTIKIFNILSKIKKLKILEMGSGFSTLWWQKKNIKSLTSVETNYDWYIKIKKQLKNSKKINFLFYKKRAEYKIQKLRYDLVIVDAYERFEDLKLCLKLIDKKNTIIYLDDSDNDSSFKLNSKIHKDMRLAENLLRKFAHENNHYILVTNNFSPAQMYVKKGMFSIPKKYIENFKQLRKFAV